MRIYTSDDADARNRLKADMLKGVLSGYNIKRYDLIIAKCIFAGFSPRRVYIASQILINPTLATKDYEHARVAQYIKFGWNEAEAWQDCILRRRTAFVCQPS
jgi:hypothetical protein